MCVCKCVGIVYMTAHMLRVNACVTLCELVLSLINNCLHPSGISCAWSGVIKRSVQPSVHVCVFVCVCAVEGGGAVLLS